MYREFLGSGEADHAMFCTLNFQLLETDPPLALRKRARIAAFLSVQVSQRLQIGLEDAVKNEPSIAVSTRWDMPQIDLRFRDEMQYSQHLR